MHRVLTFVIVVVASCGLVACASRRIPTGAAPLSSVLASPAVAASLVGVVSETAMPLPTPSAGSEGTLPPMEPGGRSTDSADPDGADAAQLVIDVFAQEVEATAYSADGYCGVAIDAVHDGLTVWWHGTPPAGVLAVLDRVKVAKITPTVVAAPYDHRTLLSAGGRIDMQGLGITMWSMHSDCSGLDIGLPVVTAAAQARVRAAVPAWVPLDFVQQSPASW
ncbi:MAG: hypothetical protein QOC73_725 [Actinomycetota bacterium]|nr:hypothetical protein [Actinomycetota bacterium]